MAKQWTDVDEGWVFISEMFHKMARGIVGAAEGVEQFSMKDKAETYTCIFQLCTGQKQLEEELYNRYKALWDDYFDREVVPQLEGLPSQEMLIMLHKKYDAHLKMIRLVPGCIFRYLDKYYTPKKNCPSTTLVAYHCFRDKVFHMMDSGIQKSVLELVYKQREGEPVNTGLIKTIVQIFQDVGMRQVPQAKSRAQISVGAEAKKKQEEPSMDVYEKMFEVDFLQATREYYKRKSQKWTEEDSFPDYMRKAEDLYNQERQRCDTYLHESTEPKLLAAIDAELIGAHQMKLLNNQQSGHTVLMETYMTCGGTDMTDLARMFSLFVRLEDSATSGLTPIAEMTCAFIKQVGDDTINKCEGEDGSKEFVELLVEKYQLFDNLVNDAFKRDHRFKMKMKEAFEYIVNQDVVIKPAQPGGKAAKTRNVADLMADFLDEVLKGKKKLADNEIVTVMESCVAIFQHLQEKDIFQNYHQAAMAKRLLTQTNPDVDKEKHLIQMLKAVAGVQFTAKMEKMVQDHNDISILQDAFEEVKNDDVKKGKIKVPGNNGEAVKFEVEVLTRSNWPQYKVESMEMPEVIQKCMDVYETFYVDRKERTQLQWLHTLGSAQCALNYVTGDIQPTVTVSVIQAAILVLFNQRPEMTFGQVCEALKMEPDYCDKFFDHKSLGMACGRAHKKHPEYKLLNCTKPGGKSDDIKVEDVLTLNTDLNKGVKKPKKKYSMQMIEMKVTSNESADIDEQINKQRKMNIQAKIVMVMKSRKRMKIEMLKMEVIDKLSGLFRALPKYVHEHIMELSMADYAEGQILKPVGDQEVEYMA